MQIDPRQLNASHPVNSEGLEVERIASLVSSHRQSPSADTAAVFDGLEATLSSMWWQAPECAWPVASQAFTDMAAWWFYSGNPYRALATASKAVDVASASKHAPSCRLALAVRGTVLVDLADVPGALSDLNEALDYSLALSDVRAQVACWNQIGLALLSQGLAREACTAFDKALELVDTDGRLLPLRVTVLSNKALAAMDVPEQAAEGLRAAIAATTLAPEPRSAEELANRVSIELTATQFLSRVGETKAAKRHARAANQYATRVELERAKVCALLAEGTASASAADYGPAFELLRRALDMARQKVKAFQIPALRALITAYEASGHTELAKVYLEELFRLAKTTREQRVVQQQNVQLQQILGPDFVQASSALDIDLTDRRGRLTRAAMSAGSARELMRMYEEQANAAELHDDATSQHIFRVGRMSALIAKEIGLDESTQQMLDLAARLHDIGKLSTPDSILLKPGKLTDAEREIMQAHTINGARYLETVKLPSIEIAREIALAHHEKWDGTGYPYRLKGSAIPLSARIAAVADVFDALTHERPYKRAWSIPESLEEMRAQSGKHFDPDLIAVFLSLVPRLQREVSDLDAYLAQESQNSRFVLTRQALARKLKGEDPATTSFDLRR